MKILPVYEIWGVVTISVVLIYLCASSVNAQELNFYDDDGNVFTLTITGGCYNFKPKWNNRATSVEVDNNCYNVYDKPGCRGRQLRIQRGSRGIKDLKQVDFDRTISSVNLCSPEVIESVSSSSSGITEVRRNENKSVRVSRASLQDAREAAVEAHNFYRARHQVPPLSGDERLHEEAQKYAEHLAATHRFEPSRTYKYGENLATSFKRNKVDAVKDAVKRWYDKIKNYDFDRPGYNVDGQPSGSFTAVVWRKTEKLGIGIAWDEVEEAYIVVAFYEPQGLESSKLLELAEVNSGKTSRPQLTEHLSLVFAASILLGIYSNDMWSS